MLDEIRILKRLSELFGPSTEEDEVIKGIQDELNSGYRFLVTSHKNLIVIPNNLSTDQFILFQAHMDELGLRPYRYQPDGYIELTPMGGVPAGASNQIIRFSPTGVTGLLMTYAHEKHVRYFADIGAKDGEEALKMVPYFSNGAYSGVNLEESPAHLLGKSFDDRAGCAAIVSALRTLASENSSRWIAVFTAREETGNWPVHELYRLLMAEGLSPALIVNVECCPGGPTPGDPHPLATIGRGIVLVNMDASYEPDSSICRFMDELAESNDILRQHMAVRDGSGELGRLALGFGCPGYPLTIPCRYMHSPHSVMAKSDFRACIEMICRISTAFKTP
jgi:putative aminopeptidase FrvX